MCQTSHKLPGLECRHVLMCMIEMGWWIISLVNTQGKCYSVRNTGSSEEKNYYHIRCSMTHCCCYICFFCCCCCCCCCFFLVILRQPNKIKLISELYRKKVNEPQHTNTQTDNQNYNEKMWMYPISTWICCLLCQQENGANLNSQVSFP